LRAQNLITASLPSLADPNGETAAHVDHPSWARSTKRVAATAFVAFHLQEYEKAVRPIHCDLEPLGDSPEVRV
jgi:hypothetical protein